MIFATPPSTTARNITMGQLIGNLLDCIVDDDLIDAVIDDV